jgi:hypothetical protein
MRRRWAEPLLLAGLTVAGLGGALLGDGLVEWLGDLTLALPLLATLRHILRAAPKQESR